MFALPLIMVTFNTYLDFNNFPIYYLPFYIYHDLRITCDSDIRCGQWYDVSVSSSGVTLEKRTDLLQRAEVRICAFDIETTKLPLKFPDADYDLIMMISYMIDGHGYLIINREVIKMVNTHHYFLCILFLGLAFL